METKNITGKLPAFKLILFMAFMFLFPVTIFSQNSALTLDKADIYFQPVFSNGGIIGYNLFVRKKPGVESVMLTEPNGSYALRSTEWNSINGYEKRELSGVVLSDLNSRYSILSSTPRQDNLLGEAFQLFIPLKVVYGRPAPPAGPVLLHIENGVQINIRTFDHKYADPNTGRHQNNLFMILFPIYAAEKLRFDNRILTSSVRHEDQDLSALKRELRKIIIDSKFLEQSTDGELRRFLYKAFWDKDHEQQ